MVRCGGTCESGKAFLPFRALQKSKISQQSTHFSVELLLCPDWPSWLMVPRISFIKLLDVLPQAPHLRVFDRQPSVSGSSSGTSVTTAPGVIGVGVLRNHPILQRHALLGVLLIELQTPHACVWLPSHPPGDDNLGGRTPPPPCRAHSSRPSCPDGQSSYTGRGTELISKSGISTSQFLAELPQCL